MAEAVRSCGTGWSCSRACPRPIGARRELDLQVALGVALIADARLGGAGGGAGLRPSPRALRADRGHRPALARAVRAMGVPRRARRAQRGARSGRRAAAPGAGPSGGFRNRGGSPHRRDRCLLARRGGRGPRDLERALALYDPERHRSLALLYVQDPRVAALSVLSWTLLVAGLSGAGPGAEPRGARRPPASSLTSTRWRTPCCSPVSSSSSAGGARGPDRAEALVELATEQSFPHFLAAAR